MGQSQVCGSSYRGRSTEHMFSAPERRAVYRVIAERRDMRQFVPGGVVSSEDVLARLLHAARAQRQVSHGALSASPTRHSSDASTRSSTTNAYSPPKPTGAREEFTALKVEGILDCRFGLVLCDRRGSHLRPAHPAPDGPGVGVVRHQNLWLAARSKAWAWDGCRCSTTTRLAALLAMPRRRTGGHLVPGAGAEFPDRPAGTGWLGLRAATLGRLRKPVELSSALATDHHHGE